MCQGCMQDILHVCVSVLYNYIIDMENSVLAELEGVESELLVVGEQITDLLEVGHACVYTCLY